MSATSQIQRTANHVQKVNAQLKHQGFSEAQIVEWWKLKLQTNAKNGTGRA